MKWLIQGSFAIAILLFAGTIAHSQTPGWNQPMNPYTWGYTSANLSVNLFSGDVAAQTAAMDPASGQLEVQSRQLIRDPFTGAIEIATRSLNPLTGMSQSDRVVTDPLTGTVRTSREHYNRITAEIQQTESYHQTASGAYRTRVLRYDPSTGQTESTHLAYNVFTGATRLAKRVDSSSGPARQAPNQRPTAKKSDGRREPIGRFVYEWSEPGSTAP